MEQQNHPDEDETPFEGTTAYKELERLAAKPYDLTLEGALSVERIASYVGEACGFRLLYGTERVDTEVMRKLLALANERKVLDKIHALQEGAVLNRVYGYPSENRSVFHTGLRDLFDGGKKQRVSFAAENHLKIKAQVELLRSFMAELENSPEISDLVIVGIGGSELGPKACYKALEYLRKGNRRVHFIGNVDPDCAAATIQGLELLHTLVAVVSKSGTTLETGANEALLRLLWEKEGLDSNRHFVAVTSEGSPMDDLQRYRAVFQIWDWIGGRYSSSSMVGGLPLAFAFGFDVFIEFLRGAQAMDVAALSGDLHKNLPLLAALLGIWNRNFLGYPSVAFIPYSDALRDFGAHLQQLDMESNGKRTDIYGRVVPFHTGPIFWGQPGTNAQHSFFQLIHQGTDVVPLEMVGFTNSQWQSDHLFEGTTMQQKLLANLFAQAIALATGQFSSSPNSHFPGNIPSFLLLAERLTPFHLGALLSLYENKVVFQGFIWGINSFDQEGVQLGKRLADRLLGAMRDQNSHPYALGEAFLRQQP